MKTALRREIKEETGLSIHDIEFTSLQEFIFEAFYKKGHFIFIDFVCRTNADESDVVLNDEAQEYTWVSMEEALALPVEPYTRRLIEQVMSSNNTRST